MSGKNTKWGYKYMIRWDEMWELRIFMPLHPTGQDSVRGDIIV